VKEHRLRRDLGDFQTPSELVTQVLDVLGPIGQRWPRVLEPTCGRGQFLRGLLERSSRPREIQAFEIQHSHWKAANSAVEESHRGDVHVGITRADFFSVDLERDMSWNAPGPMLVVGNPPWVTNSELGTLARAHRPPRRNVKSLRGLEARTGSSNFDVAEAVWLKLILELADQAPTIALLCKTSVARNVLAFSQRGSLPIASASIRRIDAARWFRAAVDACLFCVKLGRPDSGLRVPVYSSLEGTAADSVVGFAAGKLIADCEAHARWSFADGACPRTWRQGLKHDAAGVMELHRPPRTDVGRRAFDRDAAHWCNKDNEIVAVEPEFIYPLVKGTDLARPSGKTIERAVLVTQQRIGQDTIALAHEAPRLWSYLEAHQTRFHKRRSSIYRGRPPFAIFGIGPYSFAPFKVAISGLHKTPVFRALGPIGGRPVMLDDTCYFLPCATAEEAAVLAAICNDPSTLGLIAALSVREAKRPVTKALLQRLDLEAILGRTDHTLLAARAQALLEDELFRPPPQSVAEFLAILARGFARKPGGPQETWRCGKLRCDRGELSSPGSVL
jgi:hypothetical protein